MILRTRQRSSDLLALRQRELAGRPPRTLASESNPSAFWDHLRTRSSDGTRSCDRRPAIACASTIRSCPTRATTDPAHAAADWSSGEAAPIASSTRSTTKPRPSPSFGSSTAPTCTDPDSAGRSPVQATNQIRPRGEGARLGETGPFARSLRCERTLSRSRRIPVDPTPGRLRSRGAPTGSARWRPPRR